MKTRLDFEFNLVLEEARVLHHFVIEDEVVGERRDDEVQQMNADEGDGE